MKTLLLSSICFILAISCIAQVKPLPVTPAGEGPSAPAPKEGQVFQKRNINDGANGKVIQISPDMVLGKKANNVNVWESYKEEFIDKLWELNPGWASWEGYNKYDHVLTVPDDRYRADKSAAYRQLLDKLYSIRAAELTESESVDYGLIENFLNSSIWYSDQFKSYEWNPSNYNVGGAFDRVVNSDKKSKEARLEDILQKIKNVEPFYSAAKKNLKDATLEHTQLAINQIRGSAYVFDESIPELMEASDWDNKKKTVLKSELENASRITTEFADWLEEKYLPQIESDGSARSFRLKKELYAQKFKYDLNTDLKPEQLYKKAMADKEDTHSKMYTLTQELWPTYFSEDMPADKKQAVKQLISRISEQHTERDNFIPAIKKQIPELEAFVREKDLMYMDPSKPLVVRETPAYMAGVAGASISSPGPYDKGGDTYYNVTPLTNYSDEDAESYLREYNDYMLQILNIHEAIPGHYVQLVYSNESPSLIKSILGNGAMIEGWACYTERMMLEEGYGDDSPELWLMYYKWFLRIACNTILDYSIHNLNMSEEAAIDLLVNEAFQEDIEASKKWKRAKLTQVQLCSYYNGFREIYDFREAYMSAHPEVSLKEFHEKFLSYGSAPVSQISRMMSK